MKFRIICLAAMPLLSLCLPCFSEEEWGDQEVRAIARHPGREIATLKRRRLLSSGFNPNWGRDPVSRSSGPKQSTARFGAPVLSKPIPPVRTSFLGPTYTQILSSTYGSALAGGSLALSQPSVVTKTETVPVNITSQTFKTTINIPPLHTISSPLLSK